MTALLGCQARPWLQAWGREELAKRLDEVMTWIADAGFAGFETTIGALPLAAPERFADWSGAAGGLRLCAAHTGGDWWHDDVDVAAVVSQAAGLPGLGCDRLVVSGRQLADRPTVEELARFTGNLGRLDRECRAVGVHIAYHNHAGELAHDALVLDAIVSESDVALAPDLGWVAYTGVDVPSFVTRFADRIDYLHVRDILDGDFIEVGRGSLDYAAIVGELDNYSGWYVAESELGDRWSGLTDPEATVAAQYDGLRRVVG